MSVQKIFLNTAFALAILAITATLPTGYGAVFAANVTIKAHTNQPASETSYQYVYLTQFAERVHRGTQGRVSTKIFPGGQLGKDTAVLQQVQLGAVEMGIFAFPHTSKLFRPFNAFLLPFLFGDHAAGTFALEGPTAQKLYADFEKATGIKVLGAFNGGFRGITNSVKPITSVTDFAGMKIRVPGSPVLIATLQKLGINPISMSTGEIFTALQQKTIDGQESGVAWGFGKGFAEVQKYLTETRHAVSGTVMVINTKFLNSLSAADQKAVAQAARDATLYINGFTRMYDRSVIDKYKAAGIKVTTLDNKKLRPLVKEVWDKYAEEVGGIEIIKSIIKDGEHKY